MASKKVDIVRDKINRIERRLSEEDLDPQSEDFPDCFDKSLKNISERLSDLRDTHQKTQSLKSVDIKEGIRREIYEKLENIEDQLNKGVENHYHSVILADSQKNQDDYQAMKKLLDLANEDSRLKSSPILSFEEDVMINPLEVEGEIETAIINFSPLDTNFALYYPLLVHELGHLYAWKNKNRIFEEFDEKFNEKYEELKEREKNKPDSDKRMDMFVEYWEWWKQEFAADAFASKVLGKGYYYTILYYILKGNAHRVVHHHPARSMRIKAIEKYLGIETVGSAKKFFSASHDNMDYDFMFHESLVDSIFSAVDEEFEIDDSDSSLEELKEDLMDSGSNPSYEDRYKVFEAAWALFLDDQSSQRVNNKLREFLLEINS